MKTRRLLDEVDSDVFERTLLDAGRADAVGLEARRSILLALGVARAGLDDIASNDSTVVACADSVRSDDDRPSGEYPAVVSIRS